MLITAGKVNISFLDSDILMLICISSTASIIAALVIAIGSSLVVSFSMASLSESFNEHCFMNATLFMERRKNDTSQEELEGGANLTYKNCM